MRLTFEVIATTEPSARFAPSHSFDERGGRIGRWGQSDWVLPHKKVSNRHAVVTFRKGVFYIEDAGSSNGTAMNAVDNRLEPGRPRALRTGDRILIEPYEIHVTVGDESSERPAANPWPKHEPSPIESFGAPASSELLPPSAVPSSVPLDPVEALFGPEPQRANPAPSAQRVESLWSEPSPLEMPFRPQEPIPSNYNPLAPGESSVQLRDVFEPPVPARVEFETVPPPPVVQKTSPAPAPSAPAPIAPAPPAAAPAGFLFEDVRLKNVEPPVSVSEPISPPAPVASATATPEPIAVSPGASSSAQAVPPSHEDDAAPGSDRLLASLLEGAGLPASALTPELAKDLGRILHVVVSGLMETLRARHQIKEEFRVAHTHFRSKGNNPLKFSANVDDALHNLLVKRNSAFLPPVEAFADAFDDVRNHQIALFVGMREAFQSLLQEFHPDRVQRACDEQLKGALISAPAKMRYWDHYRDWYQKITRDPDTAFRSLFGEDFATAYEAQQRRLKEKNKENSKD